MKPKSWICAAVTPVLALATWFHLQAYQLENWDERHYVTRAQRMYQSYRSHGIAEALRTAFWDRGWEPTLHPTLLFPILALNRGHVMNTVAVSTSLFFVIFLFVSGLLFLEFVPGMEAALGVLLLGTCPYIFGAGIEVNAEIFFLTFSALAVYFLLRSDWLQNRTASLLAGCALALAFCCRPIEPLFCLIFPLSYYLFRMYGLDLIGKAELTWLAASSLATLSLPFLALGTHPISISSLLWIYVLIQAGLAMTYVAIIRGRRKSHILKFLGISQWIPFFYFAPITQAVHKWIYGCTFGASTFLTVGGTEKNWWWTVRHVFLEANGLIIVGLLFIAIAFLKVSKKKLPAFIKIACAGFLIAISVGATTYNADARYYLSLISLLIGAILIQLFSTETRLRASRLTLVGLIIVLQFYHLGTYLDQPLKNDPLSPYLGAQQEVLKTFRTLIPARETVRKIAELIRARPDAPGNVLILQTWRDGDAINDPDTLNLFALEDGIPISFSTAWLDSPDLKQEMGAVRDYQASYLLFEEPNGAEARGMPASVLAGHLLGLASTPKSTLKPDSIEWTKDSGAKSRLWLFKTSELPASML